MRQVRYGYLWLSATMFAALLAVTAADAVGVVL